MEQQDGAAQDPNRPTGPTILRSSKPPALGASKPITGTSGASSIMPTPDLETAILGSLGVDLRSKASLQQAIEAAASASARSPLAPAILLTAGGPHEVLFRCPPAGPAGCDAPNSDGRRTCSGTEDCFRRRAHRRHPGTGWQAANEQAGRLPDDLPLGYHQMTHRNGRETSRPSRADCLPEPGL